MKVGVMKILFTVLSLIFSTQIFAKSTVNFEGKLLKYQAKARACYMGFIQVYNARYYADRNGSHQCVNLSYLRKISAEQLGEATEKIFIKRHGKAANKRYAKQLGRVKGSFAKVSKGSRYQYCVSPKGGVLSGNKRKSLVIRNKPFADKLFQIWVNGTTGRKPLWNSSDCTS